MQKGHSSGMFYASSDGVILKKGQVIKLNLTTQQCLKTTLKSVCAIFGSSAYPQPSIS
jgi:hypothetical protein